MRQFLENMTSYDKDWIARAASGELFKGKPGCTLADFPELKKALRHENYLIRDITPADRMQYICRMLLDDDYFDVSFADGTSKGQSRSDQQLERFAGF